MLMNIIGQCFDSGDSSGASSLMDIYETLLVLVSRLPVLPTSTRSELDSRRHRCLANISLSLFGSSWNVVGIEIMIPISEFLP